MTLPLTPETLRLAFDYLATTPPFNKWNLPDGEDISFRVVRIPTIYGWYIKKDKRQIIAISSGAVGATDSLMRVMAHEMLHLHQNLSGMESPGAEHNAAFNKLAARICKVHGFDPKMF